MKEPEYIRKIQESLITLLEPYLGLMITRYGEERPAVIISHTVLPKRFEQPFVTCIPLGSCCKKEEIYNKFSLIIDLETGISVKSHKDLLKKVDHLILRYLPENLLDGNLISFEVMKKPLVTASFKNQKQYVTRYVADMKFIKPLFQNFENSDYWDICGRELD